MIKDLGCRYVIIGHSERRQWFGETDAGVNKKIRAALRHGLRPIVCVGESLSDREQGRTESVITEQIRKGLEGLSNQELSAVTLAYEPVWAIGTGRAASPEQAAAVHGFLRRTLIADRDATVGHTRILYGGSVTPENARGFFASSEVDGALVGGSCLDPRGFATIIELASR
jgi:triosephosphate isomerase